MKPWRRRHLRKLHQLHGPTFSTVVTTANIEGNLDEGGTRRAIAIALEGSDLVGAQEMQNRRAGLYVDPTIWGTLQGHHGSQARCAMWYRKEHFELLEWGVEVLHLSRLFKSATRHFLWARLVDKRTGRIFTVLVLHFGPHADDAQGGITNMPRGRLVKKAIDVVLRKVSGTGGNVVVIGDLNVDARLDMHHHDRTDLIERFRSKGLVSAAVHFGRALATHGRHASYDQIFARLVRGVALVRQWTRQNGPGDHLAYSVELASTVRQGWPHR